ALRSRRIRVGTQLANCRRRSLNPGADLPLSRSLFLVSIADIRCAERRVPGQSVGERGSLGLDRLLVVDVSIVTGLSDEGSSGVRCGERPLRGLAPAAADGASTSNMSARTDRSTLSRRGCNMSWCSALRSHSKVKT